MSKRILVCANPDLNYIDGSSVWAQTITLVAATAGASVDFITKTPPVRDELFGPLKDHPNVRLVDSTNPQWCNEVLSQRMTFSQMATVAIKMHNARPYDAVIVRGLEIAENLLDAPQVLRQCWLYLTDIPQNEADIGQSMRLTMQQLAHGCGRLLCQTEGFKQLWLNVVPELKSDKVSLYSPVVPDLPAYITEVEDRPKHAIYAGKFRRDWMTLEMATEWPEVHRQVPGSKLIMLGDMIHKDDEIADYKTRMTKALKHTTGLEWLGAQSRGVVQEALGQARVGLSWRSEAMNDTVEYSTKLLEYGRSGCAAIVNRNPLHETLLGADYPLYANSPDEFRDRLITALNDDTIVRQAAERTKALAQQHTFTQRVQTLRDWLQQTPDPGPAAPRTLTVLVAGHDLKFFAPLQKRLEKTGLFEFITDEWQHHDKHDEAQSKALLEHADVIFCEWCLGNLKWYSHHKKPHQRLVARFHLQERDLPYLTEANWDNIDHISYVSEYIRREGQKAFGFPYERTSVIPNFLDDQKFTPKKKTGDAPYTLGMIGVTPMRKRLDRALDLLEALLESDPRYCLRVKGRNPLDYTWLLKRDEEREYYERIYRRINVTETLRHKVIFDPPGDDVNEWFRMVGFILSPSDFESFHMAIGEGMLTGAKPVIWNWEGAGEIWGDGCVFQTTEHAAHCIERQCDSMFCVNVPKVVKLNQALSLWVSLLSNQLCRPES